MRIESCADRTPTACWWLGEIDGLMTSERDPIENLREVMTDVGSWRAHQKVVDLLLGEAV